MPFLETVRTHLYYDIFGPDITRPDLSGVLITSEELASIHCPTLIMHGARDRVVPADYSRVIHAHIPSSQFLLFDAGHAAHLRYEQEYTQAVMGFFNSTL